MSELEELKSTASELGASRLFIDYIDEAGLENNQVSSFSHYVDNVDIPSNSSDKHEIGSIWARRGTDIEEALWEGNVEKLSNMGHLDDENKRILEKITPPGFFEYIE